MMSYIIQRHFARVSNCIKFGIPYGKHNIRKMNDTIKYIRRISLAVVACLLLSATTTHAQNDLPDYTKPLPPTKNYSDETLRSFVRVNIAMGNEQVKTKDAINKVIKESGLPTMRFNEMFGALKIGDTTYGNASKNEAKLFKAASTKVFALQEEFASKMKVAIRKEGLGLVEFNEITVAYENDKNLKARIDQLLQTMH